MRVLTISLCCLVFVAASQAAAFCGFYVARADTDLFNDSSKVVIARDGDRTVVTMASDYHGEPNEFAMVIPVPTVLSREQIHVTDPKNIEHLDRYTAPRLVEYFDPNPCNQFDGIAAPQASGGRRGGGGGLESMDAAKRGQTLGVTIEAEYTIGEYDILLLSAKESTGLVTWLNQEGYTMPAATIPTIQSYLKQEMKFFVAKVNLEEKDKLGVQQLRPIAIAYEHNRFMLPIRLGMVNARGTQEMFLMILSREGRVIPTNYPLRPIPTNVEIPVFVKNDFGSFYQKMFDHTWKTHPKESIFLEYAWDMGWCDPCAADPLSSEQLRELGCHWVPKNEVHAIRRRRNRGQPVYVTRMHLRYDNENFPEDLMFMQTQDRSNFQGRYILRHEWTPPNGELPENCDPRYHDYVKRLTERWQKEAENYQRITGTDAGTTVAMMRDNGQNPERVLPTPRPQEEWYKSLWD